MYAYIVNYRTESGDTGQYLFSAKPTKKQLEKTFKELHPDEWEDGECYMYWDVKKIKILDVKKL